MRILTESEIAKLIQFCDENKNLLQNETTFIQKLKAFLARVANSPTEELYDQQQLDLLCLEIYKFYKWCPNGIKADGLKKLREKTINAMCEYPIHADTLCEIILKFCQWSPEGVGASELSILRGQVIDILCQLPEVAKILCDEVFKFYQWKPKGMAPSNLKYLRQQIMRDMCQDFLHFTENLPLVSRQSAIDSLFKKMFPVKLLPAVINLYEIWNPASVVESELNVLRKKIIDAIRNKLCYVRSYKGDSPLYIEMLCEQILLVCESDLHDVTVSELKVLRGQIIDAMCQQPGHAVSLFREVSALYKWSSDGITADELKNLRKQIIDAMCQRPGHAVSLFREVSALYKWSLDGITAGELKNLRKQIIDAMCQQPELALSFFRAISELYKWSLDGITAGELKNLRKQIMDAMCQRPELALSFFSAISALYKWSPDGVTADELKNLRKQIMDAMCQQPEHAVSLSSKTEELYKWKPAGIAVDELKNLRKKVTDTMCKNSRWAHELINGINGFHTFNSGATLLESLAPLGKQIVDKMCEQPRYATVLHAGVSPVIWDFVGKKSIDNISHKQIIDIMCRQPAHAETFYKGIKKFNEWNSVKSGFNGGKLKALHNKIKEVIDVMCAQPAYADTLFDAIIKLDMLEANALKMLGGQIIETMYKQPKWAFSFATLVLLFSKNQPKLLTEKIRYQDEDINVVSACCKFFSNDANTRYLSQMVACVEILDSENLTAAFIKRILDAPLNALFLTSPSKDISAAQLSKEAKATFRGFFSTRKWSELYLQARRTHDANNVASTHASEILVCNAGQLPKEIAALIWYFAASTACDENILHLKTITHIIDSCLAKPKVERKNVEINYTVPIPITDIDSFDEGVNENRWFLSL